MMLCSNHWLIDKQELALTKLDLGKNGITDNDLKMMKIFTAERMSYVIGCLETQEG